MSHKPKPIITATYFRPINYLTRAIEVLTGDHALILNLDFNTCTGRIELIGTIADLVKTVAFDYSDKDKLLFVLGDRTALPDWRDHACIASIEDNGFISVIDRDHPNLRTAQKHPMFLRGRNAVERRAHPIDYDHVAMCAASRGLSVKEYLGKC